MIGIMVVTLLMPNVVLASYDDNEPREPFTEEERESGFYHENGYAISSQRNRPAINPDFAPDYSCLFDVYQLKCIPGSEQECPRPQFGQNDDETCFPYEYITEGCPKGYHSAEYDETGQCYPDTEGCIWDNYVMREREDGSMTCEVNRN